MTTITLEVPNRLAQRLSLERVLFAASVGVGITTTAAAPC